MSLPNPPKSGYPVSQPLFVYINNLVIHNNFFENKGHFTDYHVYLSYDWELKKTSNVKSYLLTVP